MKDKDFFLYFKEKLDSKFNGTKLLYIESKFCNPFFRYVIVENLRYLLYPYPKDYPIYFGHRFKLFVQQGYMSGGAGYVLSKEALKRFVEQGLSNETLCKQANDGCEDIEIGKISKLDQDFKISSYSENT